MGDYINFSSSVFNTPVVGKRVTQITQVTAEVARPDDKVYVVMRYDWMEGDYESDTRYVVGVAMSKAAANKFIRNWFDPDGNLRGWFSSNEEDGTLRREFKSDDYERMSMYVVITDVI